MSMCQSHGVKRILTPLSSSIRKNSSPDATVQILFCVLLARKRSHAHPNIENQSELPWDEVIFHE